MFVLINNALMVLMLFFIGLAVYGTYRIIKQNRHFDEIERRIKAARHTF